MTDEPTKIVFSARWRQRSEAVDAVAGRLLGCLRALSQIDPAFATWHELGAHPTQWVPLPTDRDSLADRIRHESEKGLNGQRLMSWAYGGLAGHGGKIAGTFGILAEGPTPYPMDLPSSFVLEVLHVPFDPLGIAVRVVPVLVEHWGAEVVDISRGLGQGIRMSPWLRLVGTEPEPERVVASLGSGWLVDMEPDRAGT